MSPAVELVGRCAGCSVPAGTAGASAPVNVRQRVRAVFAPRTEREVKVTGRRRQADGGTTPGNSGPRGGRTRRYMGTCDTDVPVYGYM